MSVNVHIHVITCKCIMRFSSLLTDHVNVTFHSFRIPQELPSVTQQFPMAKKIEVMILQYYDRNSIYPCLESLDYILYLFRAGWQFFNRTRNRLACVILPLCHLQWQNQVMSCYVLISFLDQLHYVVKLL